MKTKVKFEGAPPSKAPKAVGYADIAGQGRVPYGKTAPAPMASNSPTKVKTRGTGAAVHGTMHTGF